MRAANSITIKAGIYILTALDTEDLQDFHSLKHDKDVTQYIPHFYAEHLDESAETLAQIETCHKVGTQFVWAIRGTTQLEFHGIVMLMNFKEHLKQAEIGYALKTDKQGCGIMQVVLPSVIAYAAEKLLLQELIAFTHVENKRSISLLERHGFILIAGKTTVTLPNNLSYMRPLLF